MNYMRPGKRSKGEIEKRRQMVKPLLLNGKGAADIARILNIHRNTAQKDVTYWRDRFQRYPAERFKEIKAQINNASAGELPLIKKELWVIFRVVEGETSLKSHRLTNHILMTIFDCCCLELKELAEALKKPPSDGIPMDKFWEIMNELKSIIDDFVPKDKRAEAYRRMREAKLDEIGKGTKS